MQILSQDNDLKVTTDEPKYLNDFLLNIDNLRYEIKLISKNANNKEP